MAPTVTSSPRQAPLFVATDIDGTLLDSRDRVRPRVRSVIARMIRSGVPLALATGRPARWMSPVLEQLPVAPMCVCSNGAVVYDASTDSVVSHTCLTPQVLHEVVLRARAEMVRQGHPEVGIAVERPGVSGSDPIHELFVVTESYYHAWDSNEHGVSSEDDVLGEQATKLLLSHPGWTSAELYDVVAPAIPQELAHVTFSVPDGLLEVSAPGVTKCHGLVDLAEQVGAGPADVVCFGDMPNDIEMLRWAGLGVAMGNARPEVQASADEVTASNDEDGIAEILERWF
ncbi:HAD family hydrolase [Corynebacterium sp. TAE3-ERU12]|uniref:HAD family hydrolase n=1 Tax=Corynebacterium sp. TAE3-ERU12 TaxID=2849491 RepID=UPI001C47267F|nr:HAD family hydrolase [Corynebacterium sp. TAE3-ERU12]